MPYARTTDLPDAVRNSLPPRAQRVYMAAYNGAVKRGLSEERAHKTAWAAVHSGFKKPEGGGKWVKKAQPGMSQVHVDSVRDSKRRRKPVKDDEDDDCEPEERLGLTFEIAKNVDGRAIVNEDQHLVFGWLSIIEQDGQPIVDRQGHVIDEAVMEKAAYDFLLDRGVAGEMHSRIGIGDGIVASIPFTRDIQKALGIDLGRIGWFIGMHVDAEAFAAVKSGKYRGLSLGGVGVLEDMAEAA